MGFGLWVGMGMVFWDYDVLGFVEKDRMMMNWTWTGLGLGRGSKAESRGRMLLSFPSHHYCGVRMGLIGKPRPIGYSNWDLQPTE